MFDRRLSQGGSGPAALFALTAVFGLGAALSPGIAGLVVQAAGYDAAFLTLAGIATVAFAIVLMALPETHPGVAPSPLPTPAGN